jgi:hypothetical protein
MMKTRIPGCSSKRLPHTHTSGMGESTARTRARGLEGLAIRLLSAGDHSGNGDIGDNGDESNLIDFDKERKTPSPRSVCRSDISSQRLDLLRSGSHDRKASAIIMAKEEVGSVRPFPPERAAFSHWNKLNPPKPAFPSQLPLLLTPNSVSIALLT